MSFTAAVDPNRKFEISHGIRKRRPEDRRNLCFIVVPLDSPSAPRKAETREAKFQQRYRARCGEEHRVVVVGEPGSRRGGFPMCPLTNGDYGVPAAATAVSSWVETVENIVFNEEPRFCSATTAATDTSAAMRPYSIAVAPDLSLNILLSLKNTFVIPYSISFGLCERYCARKIV